MLLWVCPEQRVFALGKVVYPGMLNCVMCTSRAWRMNLRRRNGMLTKKQITNTWVCEEKPLNRIVSSREPLQPTTLPVSAPMAAR